MTSSRVSPSEPPAPAPHPPLGDPPPTPGESDSGTVDWIVALTIAQATTRTERRFAWLRIAFCALSLAVFLLHWARFPQEVVPEQVALELSIALLGACISLGVLRQTRDRLVSERLKVLSACLDGVLVLLALGSNQLSPPGFYPGLLGSLDVAIAPLMILTSVLRVSPPAVMASSIVMTSGVLGLLAVDAGRGLPVGAKLPLYAVYHGTAVFLAHFFTARAREIFGRVGQVALRAEGARRSVRALLEDHHDLRSVLCNLQLGVDRLHEALVRGEERPRLEALESSLAVGIAALTRSAEGTRDRALLALEGTDQPSVASVRDAIALALPEVRRLAPELQIDFAPSPSESPVLFGGGTDALARLFTHLLLNAREGNGQVGATNVWLSTHQRRGAIDIQVKDDGPGFVPTLLDKIGRDRGYTTKAGSSGIGLWLTHSSLLAAGGSMTLSNDGGACVRVVLRAAP